MDRVVDRLVKALGGLDEVSSVILYGSHARGEEKPLSDIDICVVTKKGVGGLAKADITSQSSRKVDVTLFWDLPTTIRYSILKEGEVLLQKDEDFMHAVTVETMQEYLDFKHIIDRNVARVFGT
ncbi:MAG: nucleotidyltransferase domain-containing protein [Candidatus Altiarchaeota archaeon]